MINYLHKKWPYSILGVLSVFFIGMFLLIMPYAGYCSSIKQNLLSSHLKPYQASYTLSWNGVKVGKSDHSLKKLAPRVFVAKSISKPFISWLPFNSFEKTEFMLRESGDSIVPLNYEYKIQEKKREKKGKILFKQQEQKIIWIDEKNGAATKEDKLPPLAQDKISVYFQLRKDLKNLDPLKEKGPLTYVVVEPNKIKTYIFKITGSERLKTPLGTLDTLTLQHISDNQERFTKFWVAKDYDYLIVKLQQFKKGKLTGETMIQSITGL